MSSRRTRTARCPINRLPRSLLATIFEELLPEPCDFDKDSDRCNEEVWEPDWSYILPVTRVCRKWRKACAEPTLWTYVHPLHIPPNLLQTYLGYSANEPLDVFFRLEDVMDDFSRYTHILYILNAHAARIRTLCIQFTPGMEDYSKEREALVLLAVRLSGSAPMLESIHVGEHGQESDDVSIAYELPSLFGGDHPNVEALCLTSISAWNQRDFRNLSELILTNAHPTMPDGTTRILEVLRSNPGLTKVWLTKVLSTHPPPRGSAPCIALPELIELSLIDRTSATQDFLARLRLPESTYCYVAGDRDTDVSIPLSLAALPQNTGNLLMLQDITRLRVHFDSTLMFVDLEAYTESPIRADIEEVGPYPIFQLHSRSSVGLSDNRLKARDVTHLTCFTAHRIHYLTIATTDLEHPSTWIGFFKQFTGLKTLSLRDCALDRILTPLVWSARAPANVVLCPHLMTLIIQKTTGSLDEQEAAILNQFCALRRATGLGLHFAIVFTSEVGRFDEALQAGLRSRWVPNVRMSVLEEDEELDTNTYGYPA